MFTDFGQLFHKTIRHSFVVEDRRMSFLTDEIKEWGTKEKGKKEFHLDFFPKFHTVNDVAAAEKEEERKTKKKKREK